MTPEHQREVRTELRRQVAANRAALRRLEYLNSEETGRCYVTEQVRRAVNRGEQLLEEISGNTPKKKPK